MPCADTRSRQLLLVVGLLALRRRSCRQGALAPTLWPGPCQENASWSQNGRMGVAFGFTGIWSMHFVGMLACGFDVRIRYNIPLTILSAAVAILFTFAAFTTADISDALQQSPLINRLSTLSKASYRSVRSVLFASSPIIDVESGPRPRASPTTSEERRPILASTSDDGNNERDEEEEAEASGPLSSEQPENHGRRPLFRRSTTFPSAEHAGSNGEEENAQLQYPFPETLLQPSLLSEALRSPLRFLNRSRNLPAGQEAATVQTSSRTSDESARITTESSDDSTSITQLLHPPSTQSLSSTPTLGTTRSWSDPLHAGLSREARLRIKAQTRDKPVPKFGWRYWIKQYYNTITVSVFVRAAIWGLAIVFMHYSGMWAMEIPQGRIEWNMNIVILSYVVAFLVCFVACVAMVHMEVHFGRQVVFSTIAAAGVCSMHYTGMGAAAFYTQALPSKNAGYPAFLPFTILLVAAFVCVISNAVLAHSAITSRNHMAEVILTKRRLWRIMAEKEAAEQANELKQQFISVASHEIRTPLHAVNGYCELLAMSQLTEEQAAYVSSIQQACYAINVIAGNLDRDNVELSARPVLIDLRKMVEDQARIIETRALSAPRPTVDVIVSVDHNVPEKVYLDETYTYRLLSNAQKFCEEGYICVHVSMDSSEQVAIKISDTGCGIPKSFRHALFQPFRQADSSLTRPKQGTGLGLSIVKHLVQRMAGSVDVESTEGEGSTFTVKLPVTVPSSSPRPIAPSIQKRQLKIAYRHERTARLLADLWKRLGMTVTLVPHTTNLPDLLRDTDAIFTDVESIQRSSALKDLMKTEMAHQPPALFIVHSDTQELSALETYLFQARDVVLVKRPIVTHAVLDMLVNPAVHLDPSIISHRVRFALPNGMTSREPREERKVELVTPEPVQVVQEPGLAKLEILLVEDNLVNQHLGKRLLEKLGYSVTTANNGQEAVDQVMQSSFHCCFMDCQMPVLDGFAATIRIRELESCGTIKGRMPIIALTANVSTESEEKCRAAGMDYFLPKPFKMAGMCMSNFYLQRVVLMV
ncbi:hypothetical protein BC835DRAFT_1403562 [Cytidiella melzeri]|nr:hypothetical protein BC835DRAFT_1403562 [Cytidiella melzeri]